MKTSYIILLLLMIYSCAETDTGQVSNPLCINETGYLPDAQKVAFFSGKIDQNERFQVVNNESGQPLYEAVVREGLNRDEASGDIVHALDFSEFQKPGMYYLRIMNEGHKSSPFKIGERVYNTAAIKAMKSFYYHRCGTRVDDGTPWSHAVCHIDDSVFYDNIERRKDVTGGWHDAGDYAKFIVTTAVSAAFKLYLYDLKPGQFTDEQLNIPESGNGIPDLLDEVRWALEWMLKMQNSEGGVYFKVSEKRWSGEYLPHKDPDKRYIFEVSSAATADFAAVTALGSRIYENYNAEFASILEEAAVGAWNFLENNPEIVPEGGFKNPPDVEGGEYRDDQDLDERLWASVELYRLTGNESYHTWFLKNWKLLEGPQAPPVSWKKVDAFAWYSYLRIPKEQQNQEAAGAILRRLEAYADALYNRVSESGYRVVLNTNEYYWGSNSVVLGYAFDLVQAYEFTGRERYREAALDQMHYVMGRNPIGLSYVTGSGYNSVQNPYHQFSMKLNHPEPVPGMVTGGPNNRNNLAGRKLSKYPAKAYEDSNKNYMVNETAINYTAPFVYLAGYFSDFSEPTLAYTFE